MEEILNPASSLISPSPHRIYAPFKNISTFSGTIREIDSPFTSLRLISVAEISIKGAEIKVIFRNRVFPPFSNPGRG